MSRTISSREIHQAAGAGPNACQVTKLYSDAKKSYRHAIPVPAVDDGPEVSTLNRKFRMQKDRLIAWGLEWTDSTDASAEGPIGATVERAGLTEVVSSVMETIVHMIDEVERMKSYAATSPAATTIYPLEKVFVWNAANMFQYEKLIGDITSSIDVLCDVSKSRRDIHPKAKEAGFLHEDAAIAEKRALSDREAAHASDELARTLSALDQPLNAAQEISRSQLIMPEEAPPPYDSSGVPCPVRIVGRLRTKDSYTDFKGNHHLEATLPVLVEYARFDGIYQANGVPLPFTRLEQLCRLLSGDQTERPSALLTLLGYFKDPSRPRIGLVYELPRWATAASPLMLQPASTMKPASLFNLLQSASKSQYNAATPIITPALEERFTLAAQLVSAFTRLAAKGFTHRDVNSGSITFFPKDPASQPTSTAMGLQYALRKPVVCAFDLFSEYDIDASPENLNQNIYRHPDDPRITDPASSDKHHLRFDLYSLGLILLEIGLWVPLAELFKEKYSLKDFSLRLEKIWIPRLASKCGTAYMQAVQDCVNVSIAIIEPDFTLSQTFEAISRRLARSCLLDDASDEAAVDEVPQSPLFSSSPSAEKRRPSGDPSIPRSASRKTPASSRTAGAQAPLSTTELQGNSSQSLPPVGAYPPAPLDPDFELPFAAGDCPSYSMDVTRPPRYTFPFVPVPKAIQHEGRAIAKRLCKIGERVLDAKESSSIAFHSFGPDETTAKPTFCIMCTSTRKFYKAVKKHLDLDTTRFGLIIFKGDVVRSKAPRYSGVARRSARTSAGEAARNPDHHVRPICGSSIGAWKDYEHLPPVSFGGVVLVDGEPYGMSVHHMLEAPDEGEEDLEQDDTVSGAEAGSATGRSMASRQDSMASLRDILSRANTDKLSDADSDSDTESLTFSDVDEDSNEPDIEGDTPGIATGDGLELTITQPALADIADDFFPVEEDKDDDHLDSHSLGYVHASSGIRRSKHAGIEHEIDWVLLKLDGARLQPYNVIAGGRKYSSSNAHRKAPQLLQPVCRKPYRPEEDLYPSSFLPSDELSNLPVHCRGRTSGLSSGRIGLFMEFVKMAGRRSWTESWTVHAGTGNTPASQYSPNEDCQSSGPCLGTPGDSGAWIVDNDEARVCGHVLAWSDKKQVAYIAPMEVLLSDMREVLGTDAVVLPGQDSLLPVKAGNRCPSDNLTAADMEVSSHACTEAQAQSKPGMKPPDLSSSLGRMRIEEDEDRTRQGSKRLLAQHVLMSGSPGHLEREWSARRSALGLQASG